MIIIMRCFACGKPIAHLWEEFNERVSAGESAEAVLDELELERYCCRSAMIGHVDLIQDVSMFKKS